MDAGYSTPNEEELGRARFLCCLPISMSNIGESCCFKLMTLRTGVILIALWDIMIFLYTLIFPLFYWGANIFQNTEFIVNIFIGMVGIVILSSIRRGPALKRVAVYYYCKILEFIYIVIIWILYGLGDVMMISVFICHTAYSMYFLFIIFSYIERMKRGEKVLVNNGREVVKMMKDIKQNIGYMQMATSQSTEEEDLEIQSNPPPIATIRVKHKHFTID